MLKEIVSSLLMFFSYCPHFVDCDCFVMYSVPGHLGMLIEKLLCVNLSVLPRHDICETMHMLIRIFIPVHGSTGLREE